MLQWVRLIPILIELFPQLIRVTFFRGALIIAHDPHPDSEEDLARALNKQLKHDSKPEDGQMVIKVSDAIECVQAHMNQTTAAVLVLKGLCANIGDLVFGTGHTGSGFQDLFDSTTKCIREKALRQDTPRVKSEKLGYHRPAKGHGKGRKTF